MPLYLSDAEVRALLPPEECARVIEETFLAEARGLTEQTPTVELRLPRGVFRVKVGGAYAANSYGLKAYLGNAGYRVFVYNLDSGFEGLVEAFDLTELRTGAVSAVAAKHLARPDTRTLGIIGTGREARAQLRAVSGVLSLQRVRAFSRNADNRARYAAEMSKELGIEVEPVDSAQACVRGADMLLTITSANDPVLEGAWLAPGTFVCAVGATGILRREIDDETVARAACVVVEHLATAQSESGELIQAVARGHLRWGLVRELKDVVSGAVQGRRSDEEIILFDSIGTGAEDVALAALALEKARAQGLGVELPVPPPKTRAR